MKVAVAGGGVRIGWTKPVAAAAEAGSPWVRSGHDYLVGSVSGFIRTGRARGARCHRQGGPARGMAESSSSALRVRRPPAPIRAAVSQPRRDDPAAALHQLLGEVI